MSFAIENMVVKTFSQEILSKKISGYFLDEIVYDFEVKELEIIEDNIRNSKYTKKITYNFINTLIENIINEENIKMDIDNEIDMLISKYIPKDVQNEKLQNMKMYVIEQINNIEEKLQNNLLYGFGDNYLIILKSYNIITNVYLRIIVLSLCIVSIVILCVLEKYRALKSIRNIILVITIFILFALGIINMLSNFIDQRLAGGWLQDINTTSLIVFIVIGSVISISLTLIEKNINKNLIIKD